MQPNHFRMKRFSVLITTEQNCKCGKKAVVGTHIGGHCRLFFHEILKRSTTWGHLRRLSVVKLLAIGDERFLSVHLHISLECPFEPPEITVDCDVVMPLGNRGRVSEKFDASFSRGISRTLSYLACPCASNRKTAVQ